MFTIAEPIVRPPVSNLKKNGFGNNDSCQESRPAVELVGESPALQRVLCQLKTVAATDTAVLILGETGTGKEIVARMIHDLSFRRHQDLVRADCASCGFFAG